jgi:hypothetical protein
MADINLSSGAGKTVFAQLYDSGTPVGPEILLTEIGQLGEYYGDVEPGTDPGKYVVVFLSDGAKLTSGTIEWDGEKEITLASIGDPLQANDLRLDNIDAAISTRSTLTAIDVWSAATRTLTSSTATAGDVAQAVWDRVLTGVTHNVAGSAGRRLRSLAETVILTEGVGTGMSNAGGVGFITLPDATTICIKQAIRIGDTVRFVRSFDPVTKVATVDKPWCVLVSGSVEYTIFSGRESDLGATLAEIEASDVIAKQASVIAIGDPLQADDLRLDNLDVPTSTRLSFASYEAPANADIAAIKAKTDNLPAQPAAVGSEMALVSDYDPAKTAASQASVDAIPSAEEIATAVEVAILTEGDGQAVLQAIADKIGNENVSAASIASAVWQSSVRTLTEPAGATLAEIEGSTVLAKEATLTALANASQDEHDATQAAIAALPVPLDSADTQAAAAAAIAAYGPAVPADLAGVATQASVAALGSPLQAGDGRIDNLDAAVSSRLAAADYNEPATLAEIETSAVLAKQSTLLETLSAAQDAADLSA